MKKKLFGIFISLIMVLAMMPLAAFATEGTPISEDQSVEEMQEEKTEAIVDSEENTEPEEATELEKDIEPEPAKEVAKLTAAGDEQTIDSVDLTSIDVLGEDWAGKTVGALKSEFQTYNAGGLSIRDMKFFDGSGPLQDTDTFVGGEEYDCTLFIQAPENHIFKNDVTPGRYIGEFLPSTFNPDSKFVGGYVPGGGGVDSSSEDCLELIFDVELPTHKTIKSVDFTIDGFNRKAPYFTVSSNIDQYQDFSYWDMNSEVRFYKGGEFKYIYLFSYGKWIDADDNEFSTEPLDLLECDNATFGFPVYLNEEAVFSDKLSLKVRANNDELDLIDPPEPASEKPGYQYIDESYIFVYYTVPLADVHDCIDANHDHKCVDKNHDHKCDICGKAMPGKDSDAADTGDNSNVLPYGIAMILALAVMGVTLRRRKEN